MSNQNPQNQGFNERDKEKQGQQFKNPDREREASRKPGEQQGRREE